MPKEASNFLYTITGKNVKLANPSSIPYWGIFLTLCCLVLAIWSTIRLDYITKHQDKVIYPHDLDIQGKPLNHLERLEAKQLNGVLLTPQQPHLTELGVFQKDLHMQGHNLLDFHTVQTETISGTLTESHQPYVVGIGSLSQSLHVGRFDVYDVNELETETLSGLVKENFQPFIHGLGPQESDWQLNHHNITRGNTLEAQWSGMLSSETALKIRHTAPLEQSIHMNGHNLCDVQWIERPLYTLQLSLPQSTSSKVLSWGMTKQPSLFPEPHITLLSNTTIGDTLNINTSGRYSIHVNVLEGSGCLGIFINYDEVNSWSPEQAEVLYMWSEDKVYTPTTLIQVYQGDTIHFLSDTISSCKVELSFIQ